MEHAACPGRTEFGSRSVFLGLAQKIVCVGMTGNSNSRENYQFPCSCQQSTKIETELFSDVKIPLSRGLLLSKISFHFLLL